MFSSAVTGISVVGPWWFLGLLKSSGVSHTVCFVTPTYFVPVCVCKF